jgi:hypothetical protein
MTMFWSSALHLMPPQLYERVDKWTHETRSNFNHKKHLSNACTCTFIFNIILFRKYKNIFTFLHTHIKPKNTFHASYLLYCIVIYFICIIIDEGMTQWVLIFGLHGFRPRSKPVEGMMEAHKSAQMVQPTKLKLGVYCKDSKEKT